MKTGTVFAEPVEKSEGPMYLRQRWFSGIVTVTVIAGIVFLIALLATN